MTRVVCMSDLHGQWPTRIPPCNILIIAGDVCPDFDHAIRQASWLNTTMRERLERVDADEVVAIPGNHDFVFQTHKQAVPDDLRWRFLVDQGVELFGLKIWGSPWVTGLPGWAYNISESRMTERLEKAPQDTDIFVLHGPPYGFLDQVFGMDGKLDEHVGSPSTQHFLTRRSPRLAVWGHIHEAHGQGYIYGQKGKFQAANVSLLDERYRMVHAPMLFQIDLDKETPVPSEVEEAS
jgi:Icc-related predicted phosphoesterase